MRANDLQECKCTGAPRHRRHCHVAMAPPANVGAEKTIIMRPVTSTEAMTAEFSRLPRGVVLKIGSRVKSEVGGVLDVLYDITNKPPGTIEWA